MEWLANNWEAIGTALVTIGSWVMSLILSHRRGQKVGALKALGETDKGPLPILLVLTLAALNPGCATLMTPKPHTSSAEKTLSADIQSTFHAQRTAWTHYQAQLHALCLDRAHACHSARDGTCPELVTCQRIKADMATAYGAALKHLDYADEALHTRRDLAAARTALERHRAAWSSLEQRLKEVLHGNPNLSGTGTATGRGGHDGDGQSGPPPQPGRDDPEARD